MTFNNFVIIPVVTIVFMMQNIGEYPGSRRAHIDNGNLGGVNPRTFGYKRTHRTGAPPMHHQQILVTDIFSGFIGSTDNSLPINTFLQFDG